MVLAGGGGRCLWQVGFWVEAFPALGTAPKRVVGVSAGATMAAALLADRVAFALDYMKDAVSRNPKNFYPENFFNRRPLFPHHRIYRQAILSIFDDDSLNRLQAGPELLVVLARPPRGLGPRTSVLLGFGCYTLEKMFKGGVHPQWARRLGFEGEAVSAGDCPTAADLADLLLASSCTPPVLPVMRRNGRPVLDGGLYDNVPADFLSPEDEPILVLLTRPYPAERLPRIKGRTYVQPSEPIRLYKWDYTSPQGFQEVYDLGRRDGERFARQLLAKRQ